MFEGGLRLSIRVTAVVRALLLFLGPFILLLAIVAVQPAEARTPPPPSSGDWTVADDTNWSLDVTLRGDLTIQDGGSLTLGSLNLTFDCLSKCEFGIYVENGGRLNAQEVTFSARNASFPYKFVINTDAFADLQRCTIMNAGSFSAKMDGWGVYVHGTNTNISYCRFTRCNVGLLIQGYVSPTIAYNNFTDNYDRAIWCKFSSPAIRNNRFFGNGYGIYLDDNSTPVLLNNEFFGNQKDAVYMGGGSAADWSVNLPVAWVNSTVLIRGNLTIQPNGALLLSGSRLLPDSDPLSPKTVLVRTGGRLDILAGSVLEAARAGGPFAFRVEPGALLTIEGSAVHDAGYDPSEAGLSGICVEGDATISGADLSGNLIALRCSDTNVTVRNSTLGGSLSDVALAGSAARFLNVTFRMAKTTFADESSRLEVGWYLCAGALWQNGKGAGGATVTVRDQEGRTVFDGAPGPDGWVRWLGLVQEVVSRGQTRDLSNHTITARRSGFPDLTATAAMSANREARLVFVDARAPEVAIDSPSDGFGTNLTWVLVTGTAADDIGLERVELRLDGSLRWTPLAPGDWSYNLTNLSRGTHRVEVRAQDPAGQTASANITLMVDLEPPRLELEEPFGDDLLFNRSNIRFSGRTDPDAAVTIDGIAVPVAPNGQFDTVINLGEGVHTVLVLSRDMGGNAVSVSRRITVDLTPPAITVRSPANGTKTGLDEADLVGTVEPGAKFQVDGSTIILAPDGSFNVSVLLSGGPKSIELYAEDKAGNGATLIWVLERRIEPAAYQPFLQKYGYLLAMAAFLLLVLVAAAACALVLRSRRRARQ